MAGGRHLYFREPDIQIKNRNTVGIGTAHTVPYSGCYDIEVPDIKVPAIPNFILMDQRVTRKIKVCIAI